ncbi:MAG: phage tail tape measure protein [Mariprofundaceae bacterium]|nr:phage tail tape measure protein [Mariprofundaceae bacterium]
MSNMNMSITVAAIDKFSAPAKKIAALSKGMTHALEKSSKVLGESEKSKAAIEHYRKLGENIRKSSQAMRNAQAKTKELARAIAKTSSPTREMVGEFEQAKRTTSQLSQKYKGQVEKLRSLRSELKKAGIDTKRLSSEQKRLSQSIEQVTKKMSLQALKEHKINAINNKRDHTYQRAANLTFIGDAIGRVGSGVTGAFSAPIERARGVARSRGELQSLDMGKGEIDAVIQSAHLMGKTFAGIDTASFVTAAYDIKSGISNLTGDGVAKMTALAAMTAKATKSDTAGMTSLFATGYGVFKKSLFAGIADSDFGAKFSAGLASSVKQFKTDGAKMQQAIESMGSGLAAAGMPLQDQLTALGMLQQKMSAGESGTAIKALGAKAAQAQAYFNKMGIAINTLDSKGNVIAIPDMLKQAKAAFGSQYTSKVGSVMLKAFGSEEAVKVFEGLWGQSGDFVKNSAAVSEAMAKGEMYTRAMAKNMDSNADARLRILSQRWSLLSEKLGTAMLPVLERMIPAIEWVSNAITSFIERFPTASTAILSVVGVIGGIALALAPVIAAVAALTAALAFLRAGLAKTRVQAEISSLGGGGAGGKGGKLGKIGKFLKGKAGMIGAALTAASIGSTLLGDSQTKARDVTKDVGMFAGGTAGWMGGAASGSALGEMIFPLGGGIPGALIGGLLGSMAGASAGNYAGTKVADLTGMKKAGGGAIQQDNRATYVTHVQVNGGDPQEVKAAIEQVLTEKERNHATAISGALFDLQGAY